MKKEYFSRYAQGFLGTLLMFFNKPNPDICFIEEQIKHLQKLAVEINKEN